MKHCQMAYNEAFDVLLSDGQTVQIVTKGPDALELYASVTEKVEYLYPDLHILEIEPSEIHF